MAFSPKLCRLQHTKTSAFIKAWFHLKNIHIWVLKRLIFITPRSYLSLNILFQNSHYFSSLILHITTNNIYLFIHFTFSFSPLFLSLSLTSFTWSNRNLSTTTNPNKKKKNLATQPPLPPQAKINLIFMTHNPENQHCCPHYCCPQIEPVAYWHP